jgi:KRAB domain-containing zinc finger protein
VTHPKFLQLKCGVCKKKMKTMPQFHKHIQVNHRKKLLRICPHCGIMCKNNRSLVSHMESHIPVSEADFPCQTCSKMFRSNRLLVDHQKIHLPPFVCDFCSKRIPTRKRLLEHMYLHTNNKTYDCEICGASFVRKDNRMTHMKNNHNWICLICFGKYTTKEIVKAHVDSEHSQEDIETLADGGVTHERVTRFQCQICLRYLASKQSLDFHSATHSGAKEGKKRPRPKQLTSKN